MKPPLSKSDEIAWLDRAIAELGPQTYLGATLADQRLAIVADIRADLPPLQFAELRAEEQKARASLQNTYAATREAVADLEKVRAELRDTQAKLAELRGAVQIAQTYAAREARAFLETVRTLCTVTP
jgi:hypothetical protein